MIKIGSCRALLVPRNKRPQDRAEKRDEIVDAARKLFVEDGYEATPMGRLAKEAGVTPNTIYWYFKDKDEVLVAVLVAVVADALADYQAVADRPIADRLLWVVGQLQSVDRLVKTVHARVDRSPAVDAWHTGFHAFAEGLFRQEVAQIPGAAPVTEAEVQVVVFTVEGMLMHPLSPEEQRVICEALAARWS